MTFFGRVDEETKRQLMAQAHVLIVTSVREGWGLVVDEAAAVGTPSIGYNVPGLRDSVDAAGGVLVSPEAAALADALAEHLPAWSAEPALQGWQGGAVSWPAVADEILRFLHRVTPLSTHRT